MPRLSPVILLLTLCGVAAAAHAGLEPVASEKPGAEVATASSVPLSRLTLYRSGVGSFQRNGMVNGDAKVQLRFPTDTINDILKSMVILDKSGGTIDGASYGSKDPLERRLASFAINVADNPKFSEIVTRLRGSSATLVTTNGPLTGTILSVESRTESRKEGSQNSVISTPYANIITAAGIRSVNLDQIQSFTLADTALQAELNKALAALAEYRAERTKTVEIGFRGTGAREVVISYVHELPVWKASYRLVLPDDSGKGAKPSGTPAIQGWAIVENTTDEDWQNIALSLVSGRPVSFKMDLYEPLYVSRPEIPVPTVPGVAPRIYALGTSVENKAAGVRRAEEAEKERLASYNYDAAATRGLQSAPSRKPAAPAAKAPAMLTGAAEMGDDSGAAPRATSSEDLFKYAAHTQAQAVEAGEVFQYELSTPVTIQRQRSAMLPIITSAIDGRRVSIFNRADGSEHPMRGVQLTNSTSLQLLPGPVAVFDTGIYAGDAQIGHVSPGDKRLLAYAVDLDVASTLKEEATNTIKKLRIVNGMLEQNYTYRRAIEYKFENKDSKRSRTVLIEHPKDGFADLIEPKKPAEETPALYRFELGLEPGKSGTLKVVQETVQATTNELLSYNPQVLMQYSTDGKTSKAVVDAFREAARRRQSVDDANRIVDGLEKEKNSISEDQSRLRQNMQSIDRNSDLYKRYMGKLNDQETRLETLNQELGTAKANRERLQNEFAAFLSSLNVE